jgi:hypothetical protein
MAKYNVFETKEDWSNFRKGLFTASEVHRLLGEVKRDMTNAELAEHKRINPKSKAKQIVDNNLLSEGAKTYVRERVAILLAPDEPEYYNSAMQHGNETEPQAVMAYAESLGLSVNDDKFIYTSVGGFVFFSDDEHNAGGTPDVIINGDAGRLIAEIKCPASKTHLEYMLIKDETDLIKSAPNYYSQIQMNIWLTDAIGCDFITFDDRYYNKAHHLHTVFIPRNEDYIGQIKSKLLKAKQYKEQILNQLS